VADLERVLIFSVRISLLLFDEFFCFRLLLKKKQFTLVFEKAGRIRVLIYFVASKKI